MSDGLHDTWSNPTREEKIRVTKRENLLDEIEEELRAINAESRMIGLRVEKTTRLIGELILTEAKQSKGSAEQ